MKDIIEYIYFSCCNIYLGKEHDYRVGGIMLLSLTLVLNALYIVTIVPVLYTIEKATERHLFDIAPFVIIAFHVLIILPVLFFRYFKVTNYEEICKRNHGMSSKKKNTYNIIYYMYMIISFSSIGFVLFTS